jgi:two-component sensor histidine kinase
MGGIPYIFLMASLFFLVGTYQVSAQDTPVIRLLRQGEQYLDKAGTSKEDMDSALHIAARIESIGRKARNERWVGLGKLLMARVTREMGQSANGRATAEQALALLSRSGTPKEKADALIELGGTYENVDTPLTRKISLYEQGTQIYHDLGDKMKEAELKEFIGDLYHVRKESRMALMYLQQALALYEAVGYKRLQGVYGLIGEVYNDMDNFVEALRYNVLAVQTGEQLKDSGMLMAAIYNKLGISYFRIDYHKQALAYFGKGIQIARKNRDTAAIQNLQVNSADVLDNIGMHQQALDSLRAAERLRPMTGLYEACYIGMVSLKVYMSMQDYASGRPYFERLKAICDGGLVDENMRQLLRVSVATYLARTGRFQDARQYLTVFTRLQSQHSISLPKTAAVEHLYYQIDSASGNLPSAITHFRRYKLLSDSVTNLGQSRQLGQLQLQFETEKKDKDIKLLVQKSQLQETLLQKEKVVRNVIIGGVFVLIVFLALMYSRYQNKKRTNIMLESQQNEINEQNEALKKLLDEKEWLLKEIHHRVKNNLQIIISLLNTQSQYLSNKDALAAIRNSQQRMYAMSLIHQRLYQTDNLGKIDMQWYIPEMVGYMKDSFDANDRISFRLDCDAIALDAVQAVPVGLILNEAVSNALKYAFPGKQKGKIHVSLKNADEDHCVLMITDNGIGMPEEKAALETASLGMSLMQGLSQQLDGTFILTDNYPGVAITVRFLCRDLAAEGYTYTMF